MQQMRKDICSTALTQSSPASALQLLVELTEHPWYVWHASLA
jgi:hypothetical protein